jgi:hypothetical protein
MTNKKTLLTLALALVFSACGNDNKVGGGGGGVGGPVGSNPITTSAYGASNLGSMIDNYSTQFGLGTVNYMGSGYYSFQLIANNALPMTYKYTKSTSSGSSNCKSTGGFISFNYCTSWSGSGTSSLTVSRSVDNASVDILSKQNELKAIINSANPLIGITFSGSMAFVTTISGNRYVIDTAFPLQANPTVIYDKVSNSTEYLFYVNF